MANLLSTTINSVLTLTSEITLKKNNARNLEVQGAGAGSADCGIVGKGPGGEFAFQIYGNNNAEYGFLNGTWASWDMRKVPNGNLFLNNNNAYYLNPASTTYLSSLTVANTISGSINGNAATSSNVTISNLNTQQVTISLAAGAWYTIAANDSNRASAKFTITDTTSGLHQAIHFYATAHYGQLTGAKITVVSNTYYGGPPVSAIRIMTGGTYDGAMVQIYALSACNLIINLYDNQQSSGWVIKSGVVSTTNPGTVAAFANLTTIAASVDLTAGKSFSVSDDIYIGGATTQYKALHANNYNSYALPLTGGTVSGVVRINNQLQVGQNTNGTAYIDAYGGYAWFGRDSNTTGIRIDGSANVHMTNTLNVVNAITQNGNQVLHAGNYTSYPDATKLPLAGGTMTGVLTTYTPGVQTSITNLSAFNAGINVGERNVGSAAGFVPGYGQTTIYTSGYRSHMILGSYRTASAWGGGPFIAWGGNDNYPTEYWLFNQGGSITHSSGITFLNTNSTLTAGNLSGTIPSGVLGNSTVYIGTTAIALNRGSASQTLTGISIDGNAATATSADNIDSRPFVNTNSNSGTNADSINSNGISYYTGGVTNFSGNATDGALFSQAYSNDWQHQIAGDYRSGQIALRGKNAGTWQSWRTVLDSSNYTSYTGGLSTGNTFTNTNVFYSPNNTTIGGLSGNYGLTVYQGTAGTDAYMTFHIGGDFAGYFGLGGAENDLVWGGWSVGNFRYRILHSSNAPYAWNMNQYVRTTDSPTFTELSLSGVGTGAYNLLKYGGIKSGDWQSFTNIAGQINVVEVQNIAGGGHTNYPTGVYTYGGVMSWRLSSHSFQLYAAHTGDLAYKTQWGNDNYSGWRRILDSSTYPYAANMNQYVRTTDSPTFADLSITGAYQIRNASPTIVLRDTDHRTGYIHVNSNIFYVLTGAADSGNGSWGTVANGRWPMELNLSNNNATFGADVNAISFTGAGTGLTGTASSLSIGGNAATATTLQTARAINGVNFNGSAAITVNGLNYNVNDAWLRENGDDAQFQMYGNSRTMIYRTDGNTNAHGGGAYAHIFYYGGSADANRVFIINTDGRLWSSYHGWLDAMSISGNAANVTGVVAIANGGTGATTAAQARTNLGIGTSSGTVTSVSGTGSVSGITLSGTVTTSGNLTLGGSLSGTASSLTAGAVTDGVYLSTTQTITGAKTFSSAITAINTAKAWVHFNGTGTIAINASHNVSSLTDNGVGDYTVNFTSAMVDANYAVAGTATLDYTSGSSLYQLVLAVARQTNAQVAGSCRLACEYIHGAQLYDAVAVRAVFYR